MAYPIDDDLQNFDKRKHPLDGPLNQTIDAPSPLPEFNRGRESLVSMDKRPTSDMLPLMHSGEKIHSGNNSHRREKRRKRGVDDRSEHDKRMERKNSRKRNMLDNSHLLGMSSSRRSISNLG